jgi:uncharacterized coiled-coil protein SlyX
MKKQGNANPAGKFAAMAEKMEQMEARMAEMDFCLQCQQPPVEPPSAAAATKDPTQLFLEQMMNQMKDLTNQVAELKKRNNGIKGPKKPPTDYCWSHGYTFKNAKGEAHTSQNCKKPRDGHQKEATMNNRMGGSETRKPKEN